MINCQLRIKIKETGCHVFTMMNEPPVMDLLLGPLMASCNTSALHIQSK